MKLPHKQGYLEALLAMAIFKQRMSLKCSYWSHYFSDSLRRHHVWKVLSLKSQDRQKMQQRHLNLFKNNVQNLVLKYWNPKDIKYYKNKSKKTLGLKKVDLRKTELQNSIKDWDLWPQKKKRLKISEWNITS